MIADMLQPMMDVVNKLSVQFNAEMSNIKAELADLRKNQASIMRRDSVGTAARR